MYGNLHDVNNTTPTRDGISVTSIHQGLADGFKEVIWLHVRLPQGFTHAVELLTASSSNDKIRWNSGAANQVRARDERLKCDRIQTYDKS